MSYQSTVSENSLDMFLSVKNSCYFPVIFKENLYVETVPSRFLGETFLPHGFNLISKYWLFFSSLIYREMSNTQSMQHR